MNIIRLSENTVLVLFEQIISPQQHQQIHHYAEKINHELTDYIVDCVVSYASIHLTFNLRKILGAQLIEQLHQLYQPNHTDHSKQKNTDKNIIEIPTYYGHEVGLDLQDIAHNTKLSIEDIITIHSSTLYDVYAIGFAPGFAYLGTVDPRIASPRKKTPRQKVAQGSVAIAGQQTAVYPSDSPGGWQIIGKTTYRLIDYQQQTITPLAVGNQVKFIPINQQEFLAMGGSLSCHST